MTRLHGSKDKNVLIIGRKLYDAYMKNDEKTVKSLLYDVGIAFKNKGNRTYGKRYNGIPKECMFTVSINFNRFSFIITVSRKGEILGHFEVINPERLWDKTYLRLWIGDYHNFLRKVLS